MTRASFICASLFTDAELNDKCRDGWTKAGDMGPKK
jgi:hypothetical protein